VKHFIDSLILYYFIREVENEEGNEKAIELKKMAFKYIEKEEDSQ